MYLEDVAKGMQRNRRQAPIRTCASQPLVRSIVVRSEGEGCHAPRLYLPPGLGGGRAGFLCLRKEGLESVARVMIAQLP